MSVVLGEDRVYTERFDQEQDALHHAAFLCDDYIKSGWGNVVTRDSRVSAADARAATRLADAKRRGKGLAKARRRGDE